MEIPIISPSLRKFGLIKPADYVLEYDGDPAFGTIRFLKQLHKSPLLSGENFWGKRSTGLYQYRMLLELMKLKNNHIFDEQFDFDVPANYPWSDLDIANKIRRDFSNGVPKSRWGLTRNQLNHLYNPGAGFVYACLNEGVYLHKTANKEEDRPVNDKVEGSISVGVCSPGIFFAMSILREQMAAREMKQYFANNPESEIVLLYGADHNFAAHCNRAHFNPVLYGKEF